MYKKIIHLFICFFSWSCIMAQQNNVKQPDISSNLFNKLKDSLSFLQNDTGSCGTSFKKFYNDVSSIKKINNSDLQNLKSINNVINKFNKSMWRSKCNNHIIISKLIDSLSKELHTLIHSLDSSTRPKSSSDTIDKRNSSAKSLSDSPKNLLKKDISFDTSFKMNFQFDLFTKELKDINLENKVLLGLVTISFFLILLLIILYIKNSKNSKAVLKIISGLPKKPKTNQPMEEIKNEFQNSSIVSPEIEKQLLVTEKKDIDLPTSILSTKKDPYFICEVMITAGPRKRKTGSDPIGDIDLGEDVCGFISNADEAFVWLLDGTSDDDPLRNPADGREYFSARLLAQSIGDRLRNGFVEKQNYSLSIMMENAINEVKADWLKIIEHLPEEEKKNLKSKIEKKNFPHCSTTALIGYFQKDGTLSAYRVGDSKMLLFNELNESKRYCIETPMNENNENGVDRIFFRLEHENQSFQIVSNNDRTNKNEYKIVYDITENKNVDTIICFSDGIGMETEQFLKQEYINDSIKAKKEIMYKVQGTRDDKSICFIELKERANKAPEKIEQK